MDIQQLLEISPQPLASLSAPDPWCANWAGWNERVGFSEPPSKKHWWSFPKRMAVLRMVTRRDNKIAQLGTVPCGWRIMKVDTIRGYHNRQGDQVAPRLDIREVGMFICARGIPPLLAQM
ncbi:MAG: hypothetical protein IPJ46_21590, partial [Anaerolineales bacterium]|nr:hypothetical protein [Anaerolineales bacterium]